MSHYSFFRGYLSSNQCFLLIILSCLFAISIKIRTPCKWILAKLLLLKVVQGAQRKILQLQYCSYKIFLCAPCITNWYSVSTLKTTIFREIISLVRVNFRSTFLSFRLTPYFDTLMGGNKYTSSIAPNKNEKIQNQLGAEKSGSENLPNLTENCRL